MHKYYVVYGYYFSEINLEKYGDPYEHSSDNVTSVTIELDSPVEEIEQVIDKIEKEFPKRQNVTVLNIVKLPI